MRTLLAILFLSSASMAQMTLRTEQNLGGAKSIKADISLGAVENEIKGYVGPGESVQDIL